MTAAGCDACEEWREHAVERGPGAVTLRCTGCGRVSTRPTRLLPLFILTGASGSGKSVVIPTLRPLLPEWEIFETDILWDSGGDWHFCRSNWLRIAHSIAQGGRPTLLCGTMLPEDVERCDARPFFSRVLYASLHCDDATRAARLRARPRWRGCTEEFIAGQEKLACRLLEIGRTACDPPMAVIDTADTSLPQVAAQIHDWAMAHWRSEREDAA